MQEEYVQCSGAAANLIGKRQGRERITNILSRERRLARGGVQTLEGLNLSVKRAHQGLHALTGDDGSVDGPAAPLGVPRASTLF